MAELRTRIGRGGRIVIPAQYRRAMGVAPGDEVILVLEAEGIRIVTRQQAMKQAQAMVRRYVPQGRSLSEELIQERRREAAHE